jgi:hypothetical protein
MLGRVLIAIAILSASDAAMAEQYLKLANGKRYLGRTSSADKDRFIFCDATVVMIPAGATLEETLEKCGPLRVLDLPKYRLIAISEGAASAHNYGLAKDALRAAEKIQDKKGHMTDAEIKLYVHSIEQQAGGDLKVYLKKGSVAMANSKEAVE